MFNKNFLAFPFQGQTTKSIRDRKQKRIIFGPNKSKQIRKLSVYLRVELEIKWTSMKNVEFVSVFPLN